MDGRGVLEQASLLIMVLSEQERNDLLISSELFTAQVEPKIASYQRLQ